MRFTSKSPAREDEVSDIVPFYIGIVKELKELGY
jgi:triacylglycerol lipase